MPLNIAGLPDVEALPIPPGSRLRMDWRWHGRAGGFGPKRLVSAGSGAFFKAKSLGGRRRGAAPDALALARSWRRRLQAEALGFRLLQRLFQGESPGPVRAEVPPRVLVLDQRLAGYHGVAAGKLFQRIDQRVERGGARATVPSRKVDSPDEPAADWGVAKLDLHRHQDAQFAGEMDLLAHPRRGNRPRAPQRHQRLRLADLALDPGGEILAHRQLVVEPDRVAVALQHLGEMLRRRAPLAFVRNENIGHAVLPVPRNMGKVHSSIGRREKLSNVGRGIWLSHPASFSASPARREGTNATTARPKL